MKPPTVDYATYAGRLIGAIKSFQWGTITKEQLFESLSRLEDQYDADCKEVNDYWTAKLGTPENN